ncbi:unnamed protein product [Leuciscus chuanchicus]
MPTEASGRGTPKSSCQKVTSLPQSGLYRLLIAQNKPPPALLFISEKKLCHLSTLSFDIHRPPPHLSGFSSLSGPALCTHFGRCCSAGEKIVCVNCVIKSLTEDRISP